MYVLVYLRLQKKEINGDKHSFFTYTDLNQKIKNYQHCAHKKDQKSFLRKSASHADIIYETINDKVDKLNVFFCNYQINCLSQLSWTKLF